MQSLAAQCVCLRNLQASAGGEGVLLGSSELGPGRLSRSPYVTRMALLPASPPPSFEGNFQSFSDASTSKQIPKMEPFSQTRIVRGMRELSLIEKAEHALSDRCLELEGDEAYRCWEALFQLEKMKEECKIQCNMSFGNHRPKDCRALDHLQHIVRQSDGVSTLIDNLLMLSNISRLQKANTDPAVDANLQNAVQTGQSELEPTKVEVGRETELNYSANEHETERREFLEHGWLQKTQEGLLLEQSALMPESDLTRLLRRRGKSASWFTKPPEHVTD